MKIYYFVALITTSTILGMQKESVSYPPLISATRSNNSACVSTLLGISFDYSTERASILESDDYGRTAHMHAIIIGHNDILGILIAQTCYLDYKKMIDTNGSSVLHYAAQYGNVYAVQKLLYILRELPELRFWFFVPNNDGKTPKKLALEHGHHEIVKLLE